MVYVISASGKPLMPTERHGKVRRLLRDGKAKVVHRTPFTIQLLYETTCFVQSVTLGVDAGSKHIGMSATTEGKELYASETALRTDITENLSTRRQYRRSRRNRKTRYRKPRFNNRVHAKKEGWLAPTVGAKIHSHIRAVEDVCSILPISRIIVEVAAFDTQFLKAVINGTPIPHGKDYQNGEQAGFWNTREYVLFRDGHICRCCKGRSGDKMLNVHHIESRKTGGDAPNNLVTLCETCHDSYHNGKIMLPPDVRRKQPMRDAAFMGIMRWAFYDRLKEMYPGMVKRTYGYITKSVRIEHKLEKSHVADARCISGYPDAKPAEEIFFRKCVRRHNRQLHKANPSKGGIRKANQAPKEVKGFRLFDKVLYNGTECFIFGRRSSGYFDLRLLDGTRIHASASYKKLHLLERAGTVLTERRKQG